MDKIGTSISRTAGLLAGAVSLALAGLSASAEDARAQTGVELQLVAEGFTDPTSITHAGDGSGRLFISEQEGRILVFDDGEVLPVPFLDISAIVTSGGEQGLLGVAFHPEYTTNGFFFVNYTNLAGNTVVARYTVTADPNVADSLFAMPFVNVVQPAAMSNGGQLAFGPDGYLYIGVGDGGGAPGAGNPAQDLGSQLGKILRIDVDGGFVPPDNPFVGMAGVVPTIWAYGTRNPWRFSFDRQTGDLFISDAGADSREEVNFQTAQSPGGENYGWSLMEGSECLDPPTECDDGTLTLPVLEYEHLGEVCAVIGGYRYRGEDFPQMDGLYFYADFCSGQIWGARSMDGVNWVSNELLDSALFITTFGEDEAGELYLANKNFAVPSNGAVYRIVPTYPVCDVELSQPSYVDGEVITAQTFRLANPGPETQSVEIKAWIEFPTTTRVQILNLGANGTFNLAPGFDLDIGPLNLIPVNAGLPRGAYELNCRMVDPVTGATQTLDSNPFSGL